MQTTEDDVVILYYSGHGFKVTQEEYFFRLTKRIFQILESLIHSAVPKLKMFWMVSKVSKKIISFECLLFWGKGIKILKTF